MQFDNENGVHENDNEDNELNSLLRTIPGLDEDHHSWARPISGKSGL